MTSTFSNRRFTGSGSAASGGVGGLSRRGTEPRGVAPSAGGALRSSPRGRVLFAGEPPRNNARRASPPACSAGCGTDKLGGVTGTDAFAFGMAVEAFDEDAAVPGAVGTDGTVGVAGVDVVACVGTGGGAEDFGGPAGVGR